jgi:CRISPR-associated protein Csx3
MFMTNIATSQRFPAILIGGPPHAGKSVLAYSLKTRLKEAGVQFYLLRAAPDGEGDWTHESDPHLAQALRRKGSYTSTWVEQMRRDIAHRPLPYLVDVGGSPKSGQEEFFEQCTYAILLVKDAESEAEWQALMDEHNVPVIAILTSQQHGESVLEAIHPQIRGVITGLQWGQRATGPVFEALLARVKALFTYSDDDIVAMHQMDAPTDLVLVVSRLYRRINPTRPDQDWEPQDLVAVFDYLPGDTPLGLYGVGPIWLYVAVASYTLPAPFYQFDARRGWVSPVSFIPGDSQVPLELTTRQTSQYLYLKLTLSKNYLDYQAEMRLPLPPAPIDHGLVLEGQGPAWLYTGLALFYHQAPWIAVYQPQLNQAVVVFSRKKTGPYVVGKTFTLS